MRDAVSKGALTSLTVRREAVMKLTKPVNEERRRVGCEHAHVRLHVRAAIDDVRGEARLVEGEELLGLLAPLQTTGLAQW